MITRVHHYVPQGYLKRWVTGDDRRLTRFQYNHKEVVAKRMSPAGTGYKPDLYTAKLNPQLGDDLEQKFMAPLDSTASKIIDLFTDRSGVIPPLDRVQRDGWTRFLMSLMHRSPARVADIKRRLGETLAAQPFEITDSLRQDYLCHRLPTDPATLEEYYAEARPKDVELGALRTIANLSDSEMIGTHINGMVSKVIHLRGAKHELLTSDQPLIMSGGLGAPHTFIMIAIGPRYLFVAANAAQRMSEILTGVDSGEVVKVNNASVCRNAERYVYGTSDRQLSFIRKYFPRPAASSFT